jgi:hypothetical protein
MKRDINKLAKELRKELQTDILNRYDNYEYWDIDYIEDFYQDNQIGIKERDKINKIITRG